MGLSFPSCSWVFLHISRGLSTWAAAFWGRGFSVPGGLQQDPLLQKQPVPSSAGREPEQRGSASPTGGPRGHQPPAALFQV